MTANGSEGVRPRPAWQVLLIGLAVGAWLFLALLHLDLRYGRAAFPLIVSIETEQPVGADALKLGWQFRRGDWAAPRRGYTFEGRRTWWLQQAWVATLRLAGEPTTLDQIDTLTVKIADDAYAFERGIWRNEWSLVPAGSTPGVPEGWEVRELSTIPARPYAVFPSFAQLLNYPGDAALLGRALGHPVFLTFLGCFALVLAARYRFARKPADASLLAAIVPTRDVLVLPATEGDSPIFAARKSGQSPGCSRCFSVDPNPVGRTAAWWLAGLLVLVVAGIIVELEEPYYFTQDDNYSQFFPGMLYGCRVAMAGSLPNWNPHQFLGAPLAEVGTYALTYPFTYLSYVVATYVLGDELATVEVFCALHLIAGFAAFFWLGRRLGLSPSLSSAMGLCFVLSGYALIGGRSWYYMVPTFLWAPLLGVAVLSLMKRDPGWRWLLGTGAAIGLYFHAGNAQMWAYGMVFFVLAILWGAVSGAIPWRRSVRALGAVVVGLGVAAPLLVPQFLGIRDLYRVAGGGGHILGGLHALVFPYPLGKAEAPADLGSMYLEYFGELYYAGTVFTLAWFCGLLVAWVFPGRLRALLRNPLFALGLLALLMCIGEAGVVWYVQAKLPVFSKFKHPVKVLPFFHLFSLAFGALVVDRLTLRAKSPGRWWTICFIVISVLLIYHASLARTSFYSFADRPYPEMPEAVSRLLRGSGEPVRIMPVSQSRATSVNFTLSLTATFGSAYGVDSFWGHDPLVSFRPEYQRIERQAEADTLATIRRHGVSYVLVHSTFDSPVLSANHAVRWQETRYLHVLEPLRSYYAGREPVVETADVRLFKVDGADPMAFPAGDRTRPLPIVRIPSGVQVDVFDLSQGGDVVINYLWYEGIRVRADGQPVPSTPDPFGRIQARAPSGARTLTVHYHSPWLLGTGIGACFVAMGVGWYLLLKTAGPGQRGTSRVGGSSD